MPCMFNETEIATIQLVTAIRVVLLGMSEENLTAKTLIPIIHGIAKIMEKKIDVESYSESLKNLNERTYHEALKHLLTHGLLTVKDGKIDLGAIWYPNA